MKTRLPLALLVAATAISGGPVRSEPSSVSAATPSGTLDKVLERVDSKLQAIGSRGMYRYMRAIPAMRRPKQDKTLAPYFHIEGKAGVESLPLKRTGAKVHVAGVIAHVQVSQLYENTGKTPIEAVYVFPASTRAAVHGMKMVIGKRTIHAKIQEREQARRTYQAAREAGKRTSLLEQQRPNVFTMNVANIMPGDKIEVALEYSELLVPQDGVYQLVYPTVVGPRYGGGAPKSDKWIANPYLKAGSKVPYQFSFAAHIESPIGIEKLSSPSHEMRVKFASPKSADVVMTEKQGGDRDVVLRYRLAGGKIETGVLQYAQGGDNYFLVMVEPPKRVKRKEVPAREYVFVIDVSGSMYGYPLRTSKELIRKIFRGLSSRDSFNVILFSGSSVQMHERSIPATRANLKRAMRVIDRQRGGGGTELLGALRHAYRLPRAEEGISRSVVLITDGYVGVEAETFRFIRKRLNEANAFAFGIGNSVNRGLIEGVARAGMGQPFVVLGPAQAEEQAEKLKTYIESPVLTGIKVKFEGVEVSDVAPRKLPDLFAQRPLILFGKFKGTGKIRLTGHTGTGTFDKTLSLGGAAEKGANAPIRILWARKWVENLMDQYAVLAGDKEIRQAVTDVGLSHHLLTRFTSFVAVDSEVAREGGRLLTVKQPLPLPKGVSNYAVGGTVSGSSGVRLKGRMVRNYHSVLRSYPGAIARRKSLSDQSALSFGGGRGYASASPTPRPAAPPPATEVPVVNPQKAKEESKDADEGEAQTKTKNAEVAAKKPAQLDQVKPEPAPGSRIEVTRVENLRQAVRAAFERQAAKYFATCLAGLRGATGTVTLTFSAHGQVSITGAGVVSRCLQHSADLLAKRLAAHPEFWVSRSAPIVVVISIR